MASAKPPRSASSSAPLEATDDAHLVEEETVHRRIDVRALFEAAANAGGTKLERVGLDGSREHGKGPASRESPPSDPASRLFGWLIAGALAMASTAFAAGYVVSSTWGGPRAAERRSMGHPSWNADVDGAKSSPEQAMDPSAKPPPAGSSVETRSRAVAQTLAQISLEEQERVGELLAPLEKWGKRPTEELPPELALQLEQSLPLFAQIPSAIVALAEMHTPVALDMLYALWASQQPEMPSAHFALGLYRAKNDEGALSAAQALLLPLSDERPDCEEMLALLPTVSEVGDERAARRLARLTELRDCGQGGYSFCYKCLRRSPAMRTSVLQAVRRKHPLCSHSSRCR